MSKRWVLHGLLIGLLAVSQIHAEDFSALFRKSLENNLQIKASRLDESAAELTVKSSRSAYLPSINVQAFRIGFDKPVESYIPAGFFGPESLIFPVMEQNYSQATVSLDYLLFDFGGRSSLRGLAKKGAAASQLEMLSTIRSTGLDLLDVYTSSRQLQEKEKALETASSASIAHLEQVKKFHEEGLVAASDVYRLQALVAKIDAQLAMLKADIGSAGRALERLTGEKVNVSKLSPLPEVGDVSTCPEKALQNREEMDLLAVQGDMHKLKAAGIRSTLLPKVFARVQYTNTTDNFVYNQSNTSFLVGVKFKLFDGFNAHYRRHSELLKAKEAKLQQDDTRRLIELQVRRELDQFNALAEKVEALQRRQKAAEENYRVAKLQFDEHLISSVDLADAITLRAEAEAEFHAAQDGWRASGLRVKLLSESMEDALSWLKN